MNPDDELLHTDSAGDALYAAPARDQRGTLLYIHPTGESSVYLPTTAVDALRTALAGPAAASGAVTEDYPGELEHLRQLRETIVRLNVDGADEDDRLNRLLWDHYGDPRYTARTTAPSSR
ncbi:hypothetical protein ACEZCY_36150 [Streptacidiphilus sp. N1-12]|uniref:Uncharacterized protein n=1 Tax=Streptacidiphilus alkalitolerans TaxID=3342712 RepID=A0ABV6XDM8_9ACTN